MDKAELRRYISARKRALSPAQIERASALLAQKLFRHPLYSSASAIYVYLSYNQEVRTAPIIRRARADGKRVAAPKISEQKMQFYWLKEDTALKPGYAGIPEPQDAEEADAPEALILLPGLAFDLQGNRLGYGGGFYDRFLAAQPHPSIALCYDFQLLEHLDVQAHDIPVDAVLSAPITEEHNKNPCSL